MERSGTHDNEEAWSKEARYIQRQLRRNLLMETTLIAFGLGCCTMLALGLSVHACHSSSGTAAEYAGGLYVLVAHVLFHMCEFLTASMQRPHDTHPDAFMIVHSWPYVVATALAVVEFAVELYLVPEHWKLSPTRHPWLATAFRLNYTGATLFGLATAFFYVIRVISMVQCGSNFSLMVEAYRRQSHVLVDTGLYRYLRHPAYFGWFWRTVCAQLLVANPVSLVLHTLVTWYFFSRRIPAEEFFLEQSDYFGEVYAQYKARTRIGIPFIPTRSSVWGAPAPPSSNGGGDGSTESRCRTTLSG